MITDQYKGTVKAVCISEKKGTVKHPVNSAELVCDHGIRDDAHAGTWHRQVSLLSASVIQAFNEKGGAVNDGDFGENLIIDGFDVAALQVGSIVTISGKEGDIKLEITQKGKECHSHCEIYKRVGDCIMPREGVFAKVIKGGFVSAGDSVAAEPPDPDRPFSAAVIVLSDRSAAGERPDESGPEAARILADEGYDVIEQILIPDDKIRLKRELVRLCDQRQADLVITSGGTGFSARDITPEATMEIAGRNAPGISEYMRQRSSEVTDRAMLSRGVSVIRGKTLIVNLPGSPKAVRQCLGYILGGVEHGIRILRGDTAGCEDEDNARKEK